MLVDPRPYTYEFRKPRYSNPTFQSRNLYESLYHRQNDAQNDYFTRNSSSLLSHKQSAPEVPTMNRNNSDVKPNFRRVEESPRGAIERNPERISDYKLPSIGRNGVAAGLGNHLQGQLVHELNGKKQGFERFRVYERQQKPYNIISCYPKEEDTNKLRNFPKLTLENRLIERGSYHSFKEEKF